MSFNEEQIQMVKQKFYCLSAVNPVFFGKTVCTEALLMLFFSLNLAAKCQFFLIYNQGNFVLGRKLFIFVKDS